MENDLTGALLAEPPYLSCSLAVALEPGETCLCSIQIGQPGTGVMRIPVKLAGDSLVVLGCPGC